MRITLKITILLFSFLTNTKLSKCQEWDEIVKNSSMIHTDGIANQYYGKSVSLDGEYAVIGMDGYDVNDGIVFVLKHDGFKWKTIAQLLSSDRFKEASFGQSVSIDGDYIVVGAPNKTNSGPANYAGAAYVYEKPIGGWKNMTENAKLTASDEESSNKFGYSVSVSKENIVVGAPKDDDNGNFSGSAYVFTKPIEGWSNMTQTAKILPADGESMNEFGRSVCISGKNIVVGAYGNGETAPVAGAAYVFTEPETGWVDATHTAKLLASDGSSMDYFGWKVGISGDNIVVTANKDNVLGYKSGSAYVFEKSGVVWSDMTETAKLVPSDGSADQNFGYSVDIIEETIVIGAHDDWNRNINNFGAAYIFEKPITGWIDAFQDAKLLPSDFNNEHEYGYTVSVSSDKILVGAPLDDEKQIRFGAAYSYTRPQSGWSDAVQTEKLQAKFSGGLDHYYGSALDIDGDYAVVGSYGFQKNTGLAIVLHYDGTSWTQVAELSAKDQDKYEYFGNSVSIEGDHIVIGAHESDNPLASSSGSVYVFSKPSNGWVNMTQTAKLYASDGSNSDAFGWAVSISQDDIVVGAYKKSDFESRAGAAYVFSKPSGGWVDGTETAKLSASDASEKDYFGYSVDISGNNIIIGAYGDSQPYTFSGSAYVFSKPSGGWISMNETGKLLPKEKSNNDYFGYSVSISGDDIAIGAYGDRDDGIDRGAAYIFSKPTSGWTSMNETAKLLASDGLDFDKFGYSLSIWGNHLAVGAHGNDAKGIESGSVYIFKKTGLTWDNSYEKEIIYASDGDAGDNFGYAVCLDGERLGIGAPECKYNGKGSGSSYLYRNALLLESKNSLKISDYDIFPNPTSKEVTINIGQSTNASVNVFDSVGNLIHHAENIKSSEYNFNITSSRGLYFVEISANDNTRCFKLIKN